LVHVAVFGNYRVFLEPCSPSISEILTYGSPAKKIRELVQKIATQMPIKMEMR
jgi:hypothetical protein